MAYSFFLLYNVIRVPLFVLLKIAGLFNVKIRRTMQGRKGLFVLLKKKLAAAETDRLWVHISSMGEFEQGVPLIQELLARFPKAWIVVSLFSPSAYDHVRFSQDRTIITYLPFDSPGNVQKFVELVRPRVHIVIRHDIWPNYQWFLQRAGIPSILVNASISDRRLKPILRVKWLYRQVYATFTTICCVSASNRERLLPIYPAAEKIIVTGDTRYDRVYSRAVDTQKINYLLESRRFVRDQCFVAGSTWPADEKIILPAVLRALQQSDKFTFVIAPHEISAEHLQSLEQFFAAAEIPVVRLSEFAPNAPQDCRVLLIDSIGLLANLYALGGIAYVGGGFGAGVHSVLEPAAHGAVVCYGPRHLNSPEAKEMVAQSIGFAVIDEQEFAQFLTTLLADAAAMYDSGQKTKNYVLANVGASRRTADVVENILSHF